MSFTCWSLGQQSVQWMLHNWLTGLEASFFEALASSLLFSKGFTFFVAPLCHSKSLLVFSESQWRHVLFTVNDCCPLADFEGTPLDTTYSLTVFYAADNEFGVVWWKLSNPYLFQKKNEIILLYAVFILFCIICTWNKPILLSNVKICFQYEFSIFLNRQSNYRVILTSLS